jgi:class III lanthionine synthetase
MISLAATGDRIDHRGETLDKQYEQYCLTDPLFYDSPRHHDSQKYFPIAQQPLPDGWRRVRHGDWLINIPPEFPMPAQGWKIHVSVCLDNADDVLASVWQYCVPRNVHFKFMSSPLTLLMRNAKYAPRASSGKAVTIYPADEAALEIILAELDALLGGAPGPYILSDLRYGAGPLYLRYGGFTERYCLDARGEMVPAIEDPSGELVPDLRTPVFTVPEWVRVPDFLTPHLAARNSAAIADLDYDVTGALHFSNGGGVYTGTDKRTGEQVILKEARPYAGLAGDRSDAVARLRREHDLMRRLSGLGIAPEAYGCFQVGEHHFLAEEFIHGKPLNSFFAERYPLSGPTPDPVATQTYTSWALGICAGAERAAALMHERGVVFNDLHMFNIMVRPDDTVAFIDFEAASDIGEGRRLTVGNPGFAAPRDRTGFDVDAYSLACLRLAMFMPLTTLFALDRSKAAQIAEVIAEHFPVPDEFLDQAVKEITRTGNADSARGTAPAGAPAQTVPPPGRIAQAAQDMSVPEWPRLAADLVTAIRASATPAREDRLFPGDIEQFRMPGGGIGFAHGAAGVLYALSEAAGVRVPEYEEWLIARAADPAMGTRLGLYDGLAGVAYTLARLGHLDAAVRTADICLGEKWERLSHDLYGGLAGWSLAMLDVGEAAGESTMVDAALRAAEIVADSSGGEQRGDAGLLRGASGKALLFIRLYERTPDPAYLDAAEKAISADLDQCVTNRNGALQVSDGWRMLPYLKKGSAGIGMVIDRFLAHRDNPAFTRAADRLRVAAFSGYYAQAGLFNGRAGMILYLAAQDRHDPHIDIHIRRMAWHAVPYQGGLAFAGDMLFRLSMDLGTGTAGVLLGLAAALAPQGAALPFLAQPASLPDQVAGTSRATVQGVV